MRPADPFARAHVRIIVKFVDDYALPALSIVGWHRMLRIVATSIDAEAFDQLMARVPLKEQESKWRTIAGDSFDQDVLDDCFRKLGVAACRLDRWLSKGPWLTGDSYSLADINAYTLAAALPELVPDVANSTIAPKLLDWLAWMDDRPAVQEALAMPNKVPEKLRTFSPSSSRQARPR